jgi:hypothetical protein
MKKTFVLALVAVLALGTQALALTGGWTDNFDSYADQAAFNAVWTQTGTYGNCLLSTAQADTAPNSIYQDTVARGSYRTVGSDIALANLYFSFRFYDGTGSSADGRSYGMVYSKVGGTWGGATNQILAIGKYNSTTAKKYYGRVAFGGLNWFTLDLAPDRSVGWHTAEIIGKADGTVDFVIDGVVGANKTVATQNFNLVAMGSGLAGNSGLYFDNVTVGSTLVTPEPSSMLALASGLIGMAGFIRRRK